MSNYRLHEKGLRGHVTVGANTIHEPRSRMAKHPMHSSAQVNQYRNVIANSRTRTVQPKTLYERACDWFRQMMH